MTGVLHYVAIALPRIGRERDSLLNVSHTRLDKSTGMFGTGLRYQDLDVLTSQGETDWLSDTNEIVLNLLTLLIIKKLKQVIIFCFLFQIVLLQTGKYRLRYFHPRKPGGRTLKSQTLF